MIALSILFTAAALVPRVFAVSRAVPVFTLDCSSTGYPEACETHCFAAVCSNTAPQTGNNFGNVGRYLHFAERSSTVYPNPRSPSVSEANYRRQAIGCKNDYCKDNFGLSCDEFPYASTYDGGLGCLAERYIVGTASA